MSSSNIVFLSVMCFILLGNPCFCAFEHIFSCSLAHSSFLLNMNLSRGRRDLPVCDPILVTVVLSVWSNLSPLFKIISKFSQIPLLPFVHLFTRDLFVSNNKNGSFVYIVAWVI